MLYLIISTTWSLTFSVMLSLFPLSASSSASPGTPVLTTSIWFPDNLFHCSEPALAMNYPCMLQKMSQECAVWNNNAVHSVQPELCFPLVAWLSLRLLLSLMPALKNTKTQICSVFVLRRIVFFVFSQNPPECLFPPSALGRTTVAMCQTNGNKFVPYYWIL